MGDLDLSDLARHRQIDRQPLQAMSAWRRHGIACALLTIVAIDGKNPRSVGAQMAIAENGKICGYLTGGCLERELALVACQIIKTGKNELRRYGKNSNYIDIRLPCGSGIDIYFDQSISNEVILGAGRLLEQRKSFILHTDLTSGISTIRQPDENKPVGITKNFSKGEFFHKVQPSLRIKIYGVGFEAVQLANLALAAGVELEFYSGDLTTSSAAAAMGIKSEIMLFPLCQPLFSDNWTASVLMFHQHECEVSILIDLLESPGFYIGAIGSKTVVHQRVQTLLEDGISREKIAKIHMPAGLVQSARNATEIAAGVLAEILDCARRKGLVT